MKARVYERIIPILLVLLSEKRCGMVFWAVMGATVTSGDVLSGVPALPVAPVSP